MPQALLPLIPDGATRINERFSAVQQEGMWLYFCGIEPIAQHPENDAQSFRMITSQLVCQGRCKQVDIVRAFGVSESNVKRNVKKYREEGIQGFFQTRKRRQGTRLTDEILPQAQDLLSQGVARRRPSRAGCPRRRIGSALRHTPQSDQPGKTSRASSRREANSAHIVERQIGALFGGRFGRDGPCVYAT